MPWGIRKGSLEEQVTLEPVLESQVGFWCLEEARLCPPSRLCRLPALFTPRPSGGAWDEHPTSLMGLVGPGARPDAGHWPPDPALESYLDSSSPCSATY